MIRSFRLPQLVSRLKKIDDPPAGVSPAFGVSPESSVLTVLCISDVAHPLSKLKLAAHNFLEAIESGGRK